MEEKTSAGHNLVKACGNVKGRTAVKKERSSLLLNYSKEHGSGLTFAVTVREPT